MKINYDKQVDAKYVSIRNGKVFSTKKSDLNHDILIDYSRNNTILGIEILNASQNNISVHVINNELISFDIESKAPAGLMSSFDIPYSKKETEISVPTFNLNSKDEIFS